MLAVSRRLEVADCLAALPKKFRLPIFWAFADRKKLIAEQPERSQFDNMRLAYCSSFLLCTSQVEMWLRKKTDGENAIVVVENNEDIKGALTHLHVTCQSASALKKTYGDDPQGMLSMFPFRRIKQRPLFEPKAPSSILQIADFCAYVFKRKLMDDARYDRFFWPLYEQHAGREIFQFLS